MNLTIDTNVWLSFIETVNTDAVRNLQYWMNQEKFQLIMPEWIRTEYNKKCHKITNTAKKRNPGLFSEIEDILATIELIFSKSKFIANVLEGADEWVSSKKAPNHNSSNWDDTIILNTLIDYFEEDEKVYFIANDKHFRENEENLKLHPDIAERFIQKKITILYFRSYAHFVSEQNLRVKISNQRVNELYSWESLKLKVENMDLLSQLEEAIKYYYSELNFIPTSYLQHCYPFNIGSNAYTDYQGGTLKITNPKLYEFFQVALINRNGENPSINRKHFRNQIEIEKFEKVLRQLNENLVFRIGFENDTINIAVGPYDSFRTCQCIHCLYRRFNYEGLKREINSLRRKKPSDMLKAAYYQFKLGELVDSYSTNKEILAKINKKKLSIIDFIVHMNLEILSYHWLTHEDDKWEEIRKKIKLMKENEILKNLTSINGYINYRKFFDSALYNLVVDLDLIKKRYHSHQLAGNMSVLNIETINRFRVAELFQNFEQNGICFDAFTNVTKYVKLSFELALYASIDRVARCPVPIYVFSKAMTELKLSELRHLFNSLEIDKLHYDQDHNADYHSWFKDVMMNLKQTSRLPVYHKYFETHICMVEKILFILTKTTLSKSQENEIISELLNVMATNETCRRRLISSFKNYVSENHKVLYKYNAVKLFNMIEVEGGDNRIETDLLASILINYPKIHIKKSMLNRLLTHDDNDSLFDKAPFLVFAVCSNASLENQDMLKAIVLNRLRDSEVFNYRLYYYLTTNEIIDRQYNLEKKWIEQTQENIMSRKKIFGKKTKYRRRFDQNELMLLFNYAFIINPEQSAIFLDRFKGYSDYHDFLICPSKFNPEMIDIEWFYNPNRSLHAEEYVFRNFKDHRDETTKKILASNNSILIKRYLSLITT